MKPRCSKQRSHALTWVEMLVIIAVLVVLAAMLLPVNNGSRRKAMRIDCVNNLKQIGLSDRLWEGDHGGKYPMAISVTNGGSIELNGEANALLSFVVMSNQLSTPKILHCPADTTGLAAANFSSGLSSRNVSYFVGLDANENDPQTLLSGDDNFEIGGVPVKSGSLEFSTNAPIAWSAARHKLMGNILLADGSVQATTSNSLHEWLLPQTGLATNRLAIP
jgi:prepilin-type processing-associated H-X9-DG protein